jgi:glutaminyl-peptide cyclotransferase
MRQPSLAGVGVLALLLALALPARGPAAPTACFSGERANQQLKDLCALGPRVPGTPAAAKAGDWLLTRLRALGDEVWEQPFTYKVRRSHPVAKANKALAEKGLRMRNIVCRFRPRDSRRLLLAAHWDSRPFADLDPDKSKRGKPVLGANDAASGVAILLELARCLKAKPPAFGVDIVLFDGEDFGEHGRLDEYFLGSRHYAKTLGRPLPEAGVLLDMVGDRNLRLPFEAYSRQANPELQDRVWDLAESLGFGHIFVREPGPAVQDDHIPLIQRGVPMIDIIDFDYPQWHTTADTPAACSAASLEAVGLTVEALIREGY